MTTDTPAEQQHSDDGQEQSTVGQLLRNAWAFVYRSGYPRRSGLFTAALRGCGR
jgi:hypothetical protein